MTLECQRAITQLYRRYISWRKSTYKTNRGVVIRLT